MTESSQLRSISDLTLDEIRRESLNTSKKIPTFPEVLAAERGKIGYMVELKPDKHNEVELAEAVLKDLQQWSNTGGDGKIILGSFSNKILKVIKEKAPDQALIGIAQKFDDLQKHLDIGVDHLALDYTMVDAELLKSMEKSGVKVWTFTVDDPKIAKALSDNGVSGIITNNPRQYL